MTENWFWHTFRDVGLDVNGWPPAARTRRPAEAAAVALADVLAGFAGAAIHHGKCARTIYRGRRHLKGALGEAAATAARTDTFLGERYRRIVKRRGKLKALVAVARSILVIVWQLLSDPAARYHDLGSGYHAARTDQARKARNHIRQLQALGYTVTLTAAA